MFVSDRQEDIKLFGKILPIDAKEDELKYIKKLVNYIEKEKITVENEYGYVSNVEEIVILRLVDKYFETLNTYKNKLKDLELKIDTLIAKIKEKDILS